MQKLGHIATLAITITGIVISKKAQLSAMSTQTPHWTQDKRSSISSAAGCKTYRSAWHGD
jgi:hypothetical protein